ncbi:2-nitropropane dioxygenase [Mycobacterium lepraemurium]|nr:nitronate monooxygenase [Mycobacterium lepraemurium]ATA28204.1 2-nitropropane dioxygenase [Mycobacterium lepraemurium]
MLSTPWSAGFGLRVPIVNAPMGGVAGGRLAAAVTAAGGLGMVGMGSVATRQLLAEQLQYVDRRFGIGLVDWVMRNEAGLLEDALAARPALLSVSFGTDWSWGPKAHDAGIPTVTQVYDSLGARQAVDAGVDILVARGSEGGGHGEVKLGRRARRGQAGAAGTARSSWGGGHGEVKLGLLPLLDAVLDAVSVPVLAGGGVTSARSLAAVLAAGASGAWVGTRLSACPEALTADGNRRALVEAAETDTAITRAFDVAKGLPWPARFPSRVLANDFVERWTGREETLDAGACKELAAAIAAGDCRVAPVDAGQGVGMIRNDATVAEVIDEICSGAEQLLSHWGS